MTDGQLPATATNDSAAAGKVGEYLSATGSSVSLSNNVAANICSLTLTPGDWDISAQGLMSGAPVTCQEVEASWSATSATIDSTLGRYYLFVGPFTVYYNIGCPIAPSRLSVAANTTIYFVMLVTFNAGTCSGSGLLAARRVR
jgi:hypothetical protein